MIFRRPLTIFFTLHLLKDRGEYVRRNKLTNNEAYDVFVDVLIVETEIYDYATLASAYSTRSLTNWNTMISRTFMHKVKFLIRSTNEPIVSAKLNFPNFI